MIQFENVGLHYVPPGKYFVCGLSRSLFTKIDDNLEQWFDVQFIKNCSQELLLNFETFNSKFQKST